VRIRVCLKYVVEVTRRKVKGEIQKEKAEISYRQKILSEWKGTCQETGAREV
jgi:hypothetical protein